ncbi:MAG: hypothetical protein J0H50_06100 [Xanthomonadales bacterium]|nr:hypothetical protein [Xanthomonadales bacterium]
MKYPRYWRLLVGQLTGAAVILWLAVPAYRRLLLDGSVESTPASTLALALASALVLYWCWLRYRTAPLPALRQRWWLGHLILFIARLSFIVPGGLFSVIFFVRYDKLSFSALDLVLLFGTLFALFCVTAELERLGKRLTTTE